MSSISAQLLIPARYTRSVHLARDYADERASLRDYQATPLVLQTTERIVEGLQPGATARAFSLIGPYGAGKSAFGVFLAHYLRSSPTVRRRLVAEHSDDGAGERPLYEAPSLLPVVVSGTNSSLRRAVLQALQRTFESLAALRDGRLRLPREIALAAEQPDVDPQQVAALFAAASALVAERMAFRGIVLIIDELGQFLDYSARQGDASDLFVLQTLAEMAARSGATPCVVVTILHQAFDRYTQTAGAGRRTEWAKVQGRFVDLPFQEPPVQMLRMVGRALYPHDDPFATARQRWADELVPVSAHLGLQPPDVSDDEWYALVARAYPLHPTVLVALPLLFRQLAQNERSLFAFLTSPEPLSVQDFLRTAHGDALPIYRLPQLYGYIHATLGANLFARARGLRWAELAEALALLPEGNPLLADVLTTIGTLGALGQARGLRASRDHIAFALHGLYTAAEIEQALSTLEARKHIVYRQHRDSFVIWEGSDLDLDAMTGEARREVGDRFALVSLLEAHAVATPLVARRHSYRTGAVRAFAVRYVDPAALDAHAAISGEADGEVLYLVPADDEALQQAQAWATDAARATETQRIVVLPRRVRELRDLLVDVAALDYVLANRSELENDRAARRELSSRLFEAQQVLDETIATTYSPHTSRWFWRGAEMDIQNARQSDALLSQACDVTYSATPRIWNELIVRRHVSSSAAKARRNLIEAMLAHADAPTLGLHGYPPERAIYESVFRTSGLHQQDGANEWFFGAPLAADPLHLQPVWEAITCFFAAAEDAPRPLAELYAELESPPFGVKAGLTPLLFAAAYVAHAGEIALYQHGNYVPAPDITTFELMLRQPGYFAVRRSQASGARLAVYERLARALAPRALTRRVQPAVLDAVAPLLRLIQTLPPYARTTRTVSARAQAIRQALLDTRAPDELLFADLPVACGLPPFDSVGEADPQHVEQFFSTLRAGLQELQDAYGRLLVRVREHIRAAFGALAVERDELRVELSARYQEIASGVSDSLLRALGVRLENADNGDAWVESVAALVGRKPLDTWGDADLAAFATQIAELGRRFRVHEQVAVASQHVAADAPLLRVGIANGHGEISAVLRVAARSPVMEQMYQELGAVIAKYGTLTLEQKAAVLTELLQPNLEQSVNGKNHL